MKLLIIGSGAREHAITRVLHQSATPATLVCFGSSMNPGIKSLCADYTTGSMSDIDSMVAYAKLQQVDIAVVGPEAPLAAGVVDKLKQHGIACVGPTKALAQIESSKGFARDLLSKYQVPGMPRYQRFAKVEDSVSAFLAELGEFYVVKDDGLCGGKGVKVAGEHLCSHEEALQFCQDINGPFVIEEKLVGPEFSLISLTDGSHCIHAPAVQDHKRAFAGDTGPNTGGMGTYSDADHSLPFLTTDDIAQAHAINEAAVVALRQECSKPYQGVLYGGFMKTADGVKLIEYNARFGDPEAMNILALFEGDFVAVCQAVTQGNLDQVSVSFKPQATVCKYIVPEGYPTKAIKGEAIDVSAVAPQSQLYLAAVDQQDQLIMTGSRAVAVLGVGNTIDVAEQQAEQMAQAIKGPVFYRSDIGTTALIQQRIDMAKALS